MLKIIKKSLRYFTIVVGVLVMIPTVMYLILQIPEVQTFLVKRISSHFSSEIKSTITVGSIEYRFFNKLEVKDLLIKDRNNDTLIYSSEVTAGFRKLDFRKKAFRLGRVALVNPVIAFITDSTGSNNLKWYLDLLRTPSDTVSGEKARFAIDQIEIVDGRFRLVNHTSAGNQGKLKFNDLEVSSLQGLVENLEIVNDTTSFNISSLTFTEKSGLNVRKFSTDVRISPQHYLLSSVFLSCDSSILNLRKLEMTADSAGSFSRFAQEVRLSVLIDKSLINTSILQYFIPSAQGINETVWISGKLSGTISELRGRDILVSYGRNTSLDCDFDLSGLPDINSTYMYIGVNSLRTDANDISRVRWLRKNPAVIPETAYKMGDISFNGSFTGFLTDFVTFGEFRTSLGSIHTDISLRPEGSGNYRIKGILTGSEIDLGQLTGKPKLLGKLSLKTNVDGSASSLKRFSVDLTGKVDSLEFNGYTYRNIGLNGFFTDKTWDGSVAITDENIKLDLLGMFDFSKALPEFDFTMNLAKANLHELNFDKVDSAANLSMLLTSNFKGNSIDNLDGEIRLLNSSFRKQNNVLELYDFSIRTQKENNSPVLSLRTDFVDADIRGYYNFAGLGTMIRVILRQLMPSEFSKPVIKEITKPNNFTFDINFKNTDKINNFFNTGLLLADKSYIRGTVGPDSTIKVTAKAKSLTIRKNRFSDFAFDGSISGSALNAGITSTSLVLPTQSELKGFNVSLKASRDNFKFGADWDNKDKDASKGNLSARGQVMRGTSGKPVLTVNIDSSNIYSRNNHWVVSSSSVIVDTTSIRINNVRIASNGNFYMINGAVSANPGDSLHLDFRGIDISPVNYILQQRNNNDPDAVAFNFKGKLDGRILLTNVYKDLLLEGNIMVNGFSILGSDFGNVSVASAYDASRKVVNIKANNNLNGNRTLDIAGFYDPGIKRANLGITASKLSIDALNPLLKVFASGIGGQASGRVNLSVGQGNIVLTGAVMAENAIAKIDYLQTRYRLNDSIRFDKSGIRFRNVRIYDEKNNWAVLSGTVYHKNFHDFMADLLITMNNSDCLVLNTKPKDNELFYGTAYAKGVTTIKSGQNSLSFDISATSGKNTKFIIPLNNSLSVSEYPFISFIDSSAVKKDKSGNEPVANIPVQPKKTGMEINFDLEVTPDAEVQLIFDPKVGDVMKGHGSGNLNIKLDKNGDFKIVGDYIVEEGDYLFTLKNILNKSFTVENGGRIIFKGNLDDTEIDIKAIYKLKTSLYELLQDERFRERIPVECQLNLTGKLFNPIVGFNIYLPQADEETRTYVKNAISTDEELSRQFLYLLVMNSFYSEAATGSPIGSATGTSSMAVTTTEMLSNQLSNWLSQISNDFDIGFVYRPGSGNKDLNPQEVQVALSTQLLNDKVTINGNFDVRGTGTATDNTNQITGDFDAEYRITDKIRFKVFNRFNNPYTGTTVGAPYTQGVGIFFKQDFDKLADLFRKKIARETKKDSSMVRVNKQ